MSVLNANSGPFFSVIMNCYNGKPFVREAINSVYDQDETDWEIIFFDNASVDGSDLVAAAFSEKLKLHRAKTKIPLGAARNAALSKAVGQFVCFLDVDDVWRNDKLSKFKDLIIRKRTNDDIDFAYSDSTRIRENKKPNCH